MDCFQCFEPGKHVFSITGVKYYACEAHEEQLKKWIDDLFNGRTVIRFEREI